MSAIVSGIVRNSFRPQRPYVLAHAGRFRAAQSFFVQPIADADDHPRFLSFGTAGYALDYFLQLRVIVNRVVGAGKDIWLACQKQQAFPEFSFSLKALKPRPALPASGHCYNLSCPFLVQVWHLQ